MKKVLVLLFALSLGGCQELQTLFSFSTVGVNNPITKQDVYNFENGMIIAFAGLNAYKRSCVAGAVPVNCRKIVARIQVYTRKLPPMLTSLRLFVRNNDQINAHATYNLAVTLLNQFKAEAAANNIRVQ